MNISSIVQSNRLANEASLASDKKWIPGLCQTLQAPSTDLANSPSDSAVQNLRRLFDTAAEASRRRAAATSQ